MKKEFAINSLRLWRSENWTPYGTESKNLFVRMHIDQLLITSGDEILESLNMNGKIKGVYKEDVLLLVVTEHPKEVRKIKFRIQNNAVKVLRHLGEHFPITKYQSTKFHKKMKYRKIDEHIHKTIKRIQNENFSSFQLPKSYDEFIKICLLDPAFPKLITETQNIINSKGFLETSGKQ
ncbi:unnamed protein product [Leptosia nina]|uniref:Uncharacterized protein n=1 Tax=Leptosia nina TaxID=320188 RepID=A0AAV1J7R8_9NEOP